MKLVVTRDTLIRILLATIVLLSLSFFRPLLLILLPIMAVSFMILFSTKHPKYIILILSALVLINTIVSAIYIGKIYFANFFLSAYILVPILWLFFSKSSTNDVTKNTYYLNVFISIATLFLLVSNSIGFVELILNPKTDDVFVGLYGESGLGVHTLCIINFIMGSYYYFKYSKDKHWLNLFLCLFFLTSGIASFYGLGLIIFVISIVVFSFSLKNAIRYTLITAVVFIFLGSLLYLIKPKTFRYNYDNLTIVKNYVQGDVSEIYRDKIPRKLVLYKNYFSIYVKDPVLLLAGSGPGTFNSRTSFLLNGDYSKSKFFENILGVHRPKYAVEGAFSLWNSKITILSLMDGTRNQPFSSIISVLAEYGLVFFILMIIFVYLELRKLSKMTDMYVQNQADVSEAEKMMALLKHVKFISFFVLLGLFTDNYLEYPEVILFYVVMYKLIELRISNNLKNICAKKA